MSNSPEIVRAVVPTVAVPLATIMFLVNALVSWVASLFGLNLNWQGPRDLLRALLKPRVVVAAILLNLVVAGAVYGWRQSKTMPSPLFEIEWMNNRLQQRWGQIGTGRVYSDSTGRVTEVAQLADGLGAQSVAFRQIWRAKVGGGTLGAATVAGNSVFVGSVDGYVYEFDESDGRLLRRFFIGDEVSSDPVVWKNRLFVGEGTHETRHARLYAFDLTSGRFLGAVQTTGHTEGTPLVVHEDSGRDHLLFVAGSDGVYSVDPLTLKEQWHFVGGHTDGEPRVLGGRVYFSTGVEKGVPGTKHYAYALDLATGATVWKTETAASNWMPGAFVGHEICFSTGEIYMKSSSGLLSCYDIDSGKAGTAAIADAPVLAIPLRVGNHVFVADRTGEVCDMLFPLGRRAWCHPTHAAEANASLTYLAPGAVLYPSATQGLLAFHPETGRTLAVWKPSSADSEWAATNARATVARGGSAVYLTDVSGNLRKIEARFQQLD